jgi:hypothetical protein
MIIDGKGLDGIRWNTYERCEPQQHRKKETLSKSIPTALRAGTQ